MRSGKKRRSRRKSTCSSSSLLFRCRTLPDTVESFRLNSQPAHPLEMKNQFRHSRINDFEFESTNPKGTGSYGQVWSVIFKATGVRYALKIMSTMRERRGEIRAQKTKIEREIATHVCLTYGLDWRLRQRRLKSDSISEPRLARGIVKLYGWFTNKIDEPRFVAPDGSKLPRNEQVCLVLEYCAGGDLYKFLHKTALLPASAAEAAVPASNTAAAAPVPAPVGSAVTTVPTFPSAEEGGSQGLPVVAANQQNVHSTEVAADSAGSATAAAAAAVVSEVPHSAVFTAALSSMVPETEDHKEQFLADGQVSTAVTSAVTAAATTAAAAPPTSKSESPTKKSLKSRTGRKRGKLSSEDGAEFFDEFEAFLVFAQCVDITAYIHSLGFLHRDIKLHNILLLSDNFLQRRNNGRHLGPADLEPSCSSAATTTTGGARMKRKHVEVRLADFGLTAPVEESDRQTMCGTPNFLAPEIANFKSHNVPSDIWSLGVVLFTLLCGRAPYETGKRYETLERVRAAKTPDFRTGLSSGVCDLLSSIFQKDVNRRATLEQIRSHRWFLEKKKQCQPFFRRMGIILGSDSDDSSTKSSSEMDPRNVINSKPISNPSAKGAVSSSKKIGCCVASASSSSALGRRSINSGMVGSSKEAAMVAAEASGESSTAVRIDEEDCKLELSDIEVDLEPPCDTSWVSPFVREFRAVRVEVDGQGRAIICRLVKAYGLYINPNNGQITCFKRVRSAAASASSGSDRAPGMSPETSMIAEGVADTGLPPHYHSGAHHNHNNHNMNALNDGVERGSIGSGGDAGSDDGYFLRVIEQYADYKALAIGEPFVESFLFRDQCKKVRMWKKMYSFLCKVVSIYRDQTVLVDCHIIDCEPHRRFPYDHCFYLANGETVLICGDEWRINGDSSDVCPPSSAKQFRRTSAGSSKSSSSNSSSRHRRGSSTPSSLWQVTGYPPPRLKLRPGSLDVLRQVRGTDEWELIHPGMTYFNTSSGGGSSDIQAGSSRVPDCGTPTTTTTTATSPTATCSDATPIMVVTSRNGSENSGVTGATATTPTTRRNTTTTTTSTGTITTTTTTTNTTSTTRTAVTATTISTGSNTAATSPRAADASGGTGGPSAVTAQGSGGRSTLGSGRGMMVHCRSDASEKEVFDKSIVEFLKRMRNAIEDQFPPLRPSKVELPIVMKLEMNRRVPMFEDLRSFLFGSLANSVDGQSMHELSGIGESKSFDDEGSHLKHKQQLNPALLRSQSATNSHSDGVRSPI